MFKNVLCCLAIASLTAGCVSTSNVVPMGKDSFMASGTSTSVWTEPSAAVAEQASNYCEHHGKHMIVRNTSDVVDGWGNTHNKLIFSCVTDSDREYGRPNLERTPDVVVETR
jgi:hypothetical protein